MQNRNSFTSACPAFPYQSDEARRELGIPDSPVVHFAITTLAQQLLDSIYTTPLDETVHRITALRQASGAVLFSASIGRAQRAVLDTLGLTSTAAKSLLQPTEGITDWLKLAADALREEGIELPADFQRYRSRYGWLECPSE